ncbi:CxC2 domain-containing protein [Mycena indigotica]|uniref:CxC2 domain-containing protein n=1 Tax=Mycena indigotica TaxID=2126181 RepID=A0A8H6T3N1_9AGAR|nr:CxC2 domain-containing protein [Mycena indigotica]KAF7310275.1 CxC2 domain-containing protein [Mycena indigotica]
MSSSSQKSRKRRATGAPVLVRHHIMPVEELIGAPPDAPLTTSLHRVTSDNRRVNTETIVVEPPSPVKRARLEHLHRQQATVNLMPTEDPERYEMGLEAEEDENEMETNPNRHSQPADPAMDLWMRQFRDPFLHSLLWRDGRGKEGEICAACGDSTRAAIYRCSSCFGGAMWCQGCCVAAHRANPLHFIEKWTGVYFSRTTLGSIGLRVQLAHPPHEICERPIPGRSDFVVLAANGIHEVTIDFCGCMGHDAHHVQLLKAGWYPATTEFPRTAATFSCLDKFHYLSLHGKTTTYDFYSALESWTDGTGIKPPDRYSVFMRISCQYRHLLLLKRKGRGHDRFGVLGTAPGELATRCPACPRPGVNLPDGWENAPPEDRCLYIMFIAMDACFRLKRRSISNELRDPGLGTGWAYMVEWEPYRAHLLTITDEQEMSTCSGLAALDHANSKFSRGYSVTGVGMGVCARHEFVLPNGVGDLQAGTFASFMRHIDARLWKILSYDIVCQWIKKLLERLAKLPPLVRLRLALSLIRFAIPKMHIKGHLVLCQILFSLLLILGSGMTDGEGIERPWSMIGGIAGSTRRPCCGRGPTTQNEELAKQELDFEQLSIGHADRVLDWKKQVDEFEADNTKPNPYEYKSDGLTEAAVRKMLEEQEAEEEKSGALPIHDVSPTEFIVALLDAEGDQRRIRGLVEVGKKRSSTGVSLRRQRRKLNRTIKRLRTLQATYMPAALRRLEALHLPQDTLAERVPLIPPSALTPVERDNGGCRDGLVAIERALRDAQCRSSLTTLQLQLHVKSRLLTYKKNNFARASDEYALQILALDGDDDLISWRKLEKKDIRCMEDAEEVSRAERKRERAERNERSQDLALARAGLVALPRGPVPMETSDAEEDETEAQLPATRSDRQHAAREANALFKHGESRRQVSWIWSNVHNSAEGVEEALRIEWAKSYARTRRWKEEVRILAAEWERLPLSFGAEEQAWLTRGKKVDISGLGGEVAEGMIAYATKQADMFRNLASRAESARTSPKLARGKRGARVVNMVYLSYDDDGDIVDADDEDEHGNASDDDEM